jgi:hypothetical protein
MMRPQDQARPGIDGQDRVRRDLGQHPPSQPEREGGACAASRDQQHLLQGCDLPHLNGTQGRIIPLGLGTWDVLSYYMVLIYSLVIKA